MSDEKKTVGDRIRERRRERSADVAKSLGIQNFRDQREKPEAEEIVHCVNPAGIIYEVTKSHYINRKKSSAGEGFRLATKAERENYLALSGQINAQRAEETAKIADGSPDGEYTGQTRKTNAFMQSHIADDAVVLAKPYIADGTKDWRPQVEKKQLNHRDDMFDEVDDA